MKHFSLSYRLIFILLLAVLAASLIPLLMLMTTVVPSADDFAFGAAARTAFAATGSVPAALRAAGRMTLDVYRSWQGSFSAVFLMALTPAVFGDGFYALTPVLMLLSLLGGTFCLVTALLRRVFRLPRYAALCTAALLSLFTLQLMPAPEQGLYWYNGALYYTFYYGLALSAFALALSLLQEGGVWRSGLLCLLCLVLGGGNFITALNVSLLFVSAILLLALLRRPVWRRLLLPTLFLLAAFALSAAAPGNALRQSHMEHRPDALQAILSSFVHSSRDLVGFFSLPVLGMLLLMALLFWHALPEGGFSFPCPLLVSLYSYCLYSALYTPTLYAMGVKGASRVTDLLFYSYLLLLTLNLLYWIGWLRRPRKPAPLSLFSALIATLLCLGCCAAFVLAGHGFSSLMALGVLRSGEAAAFRQATQARLLILEDASIRDAVLAPYPCQPYVFYHDDIRPDPDDPDNQSMAHFYGKDSVRLGS